MLLIAAVILIMCGLIHSYLGERYILIRLFKRDNIPHLFGSDIFTKGTLRFCWHITSLAWFGFAALLVNMQENNSETQLYIISTVFFLSASFSAYFTKAKHLSWLAFLIVAAITLFKATR
jgi:hypothetical protein